MPLNGQNDRVLDALIVLAFIQAMTQDPPDVSGPDPDLDPADHRAFDALGPDLARRILEGDVT